MAEPVFFQAPDLFRGCEPFFLPLMETVQDLACLPCVVDLIGKDPPFFQLPVSGCPTAGPSPTRRQVHTRARSSAWMLISNCNGSTSFFLRFFISASCLARDSSRLCDHILGSPFLRLLQVYRTAGGFLQVFGHLPGHFLLLADQVCRVAQLMALRMPQEVQQKEMVLPFAETGPRPTIWLYRLRTFVGRSTITQSTDGQSSLLSAAWNCTGRCNPHGQMLPAPPLGPCSPRLLPLPGILFHSGFP